MKKYFFVTIMLLMVAVTGCGTAVNQSVLPNGMVVTRGERAMPFGTDYSFIRIDAPPAAPQIVELKKSYTKSEISWTGCADRKRNKDGYWQPNRRAKNIKRAEKEEHWKQEVVVGNEQAPTTFWAGGNTSTGNAAVPAALSGALLAGGMIGAASVLRPANTYVNTQSGATGGTGGSGGLGLGIGQGGAGGAGGSSSSSAAAAAAASAASAAAAD